MFSAKKLHDAELRLDAAVISTSRFDRVTKFFWGGGGGGAVFFALRLSRIDHLIHSNI